MLVGAAARSHWSVTVRVMRASELPHMNEFIASSGLGPTINDNSTIANEATFLEFDVAIRLQAAAATLQFAYDSVGPTEWVDWPQKFGVAMAQHDDMTLALTPPVKAGLDGAYLADAFKAYSRDDVVRRRIFVLPETSMAPAPRTVRWKYWIAGSAGRASPSYV
jgi:hypothetical protein